jgi:hypothetical protein
MKRRGGALRVMGWARFPKTAERLFAILEDTRNDELVLLMTKVGGASGHIAWAEFGRRHFKVAFGIEGGNPVPHTAVCQPVWS